MDFKPELPETVDIMDKLCIAAKRGAEVTFIVDAYIFLLGRGLKFGPLFFHNNLPANNQSFPSETILSPPELNHGELGSPFAKAAASPPISTSPPTA